MMKKHTLLITGATIFSVSLIGLMLMLNLSNPLSAGPLGVLTVFILIYGVSFSILLLLMYFGEIVYKIVSLPKTTAGSVEKRRLIRKKMILIIAVLSFVPIFLISLNSIGRLNISDVILIIVIETLAIFYITRRV